MKAKGGKPALFTVLYDMFFNIVETTLSMSNIVKFHESLGLLINKVCKPFS